VLPHVLPLALESVGSGLRIAVASLPIVEYLFVWNGLGYVAIQAMSGRDVEGLTACLVILAGLFALAGVLADARRLRVT
jgi:ABC-type dipeptide/oligopeptide/nickel transport system permease component